MKYLFVMSLGLILIITGCATCGSAEPPPNVRIQPGLEYCGAMCQRFTDLKCTGYYEDIQIDCSIDPIYKKTMECNDAGMLTITCTQFCEYEMRNSVQLNPQCLAEQTNTCDQIEQICR